MTTLHATNDYNVQASINAAYLAALQALTLPAFMGTVKYVFNWPEIDSNLPCFSFFHFTGSSSDEYQGRGDGVGNKTMRNTGILEVDAWVSRDQKYNGQDVWSARLTYMKSMIESVNAGLSAVVIYDYATPETPVKTAYKVDMGDLNDMQVADDPNPSIERKRFLINYSWHLRAAS